MGKHSRDSRESSPEFESADEGDDTLAAAARVRLPTGSVSPEKRRSPSPDPYPTGDKDFSNTFGSMIKKEEVEQALVPAVENTNNCMIVLCSCALELLY